MTAPVSAQNDLLFSLENAQTSQELIDVINAFIEGNDDV